MSCPTCGGPTRDAGSPDWQWCEADGTLTCAGPRFGSVTFTPQLVERCRDLEATPAFRVVAEVWRQLGIAEAIHPPGERP